MTSLTTVSIVLLYVTISLAGLFLLKSGRGLADIQTWVGFALYAGGFALWFGLLMRMPLSRAFPLAAGSLIVGTQVVGWCLLKERVSYQQLLAVTLILTGVMLLAKQE